nr:unnamed protein product [Callosobruchus chinensis]
MSPFNAVRENYLISQLCKTYLNRQFNFVEKNVIQKKYSNLSQSSPSSKFHGEPYKSVSRGRVSLFQE